MKSLNLAILIVMFSAMVIGCQSTASRTYTSSQAQAPMAVYYGTVLKASDVVIQDRQTGAGAVTGGVTGGIIGGAIGGSHGRPSPGGAIIGSMIGVGIGAATELAATTRQGIELEVEMDDGRIMVIVQEKDDVFLVGDRVRILQSNDGRMRVRQ